MFLLQALTTEDNYSLYMTTTNRQLTELLNCFIPHMVPAQLGIHGNDRVDTLTKKDAVKDQTEDTSTYEEENTMYCKHTSLDEQIAGETPGQ